jgi:folate-dependent phosphoribosylglycinamide formyltransferase PurN
MKTLLICHEDSKIDYEGLSNWLSSFSDLAGIVVLREKSERKFKRIKREIKRVGLLRFADVMAFRAYYKLFWANSDADWETQELSKITSNYGKINDVPVLVTHSPNSAEAENFIKEKAVDVVMARCKVILNKRIFTLPTVGTFVMHPGICPEYRNAHGCFWALIRGENDKVGMSLLKIDEGIDTGPIYEYFTYDYDAFTESHIKIQTKVVTENFDKIEAKLKEIVAGKASKIDVTGRESGVWGHPWLSKYLRWKMNLRRDKK